MFQRMVLQGITAIRICHGSPRYSDGMKFPATHELSEAYMTTFYESLRNRIDGLGLSLAPLEHSGPKVSRNPKSFQRWRTRVVIPAPTGNPYGARSTHYVKIEVDSRKVHERTARPVMVSHAALGQVGSVIATKSMCELLADKTLAFIGRNTMKWRDVYDICFLRSNVPKIDDDLVKMKLREHYANKAEAMNRLSIRRTDIEKSALSDTIAKELKPLLSSSHRDVWLSKDGKEALLYEASSVLDGATRLLSSFSD